jgi:hypothetical protein
MPSKRMRFEVFQRDRFTCYYCHARDVQLELDHVVPQALGGPDDNDPAHYVAACADCNRGKTSTSPGAPLVAAVAEDAVRWAQAMRAAQDQMLEDAKGRAVDRVQFDEWWRAWSSGSAETRLEAPRDPGWELTVDQLISAGLPLPILKDCISLSMTQKKVLPENKFRYMCGIAWTRVRQLQINAKRILDGDPPVSAYMDGDAGYDQGQLDLARDLLSQLEEDEHRYVLDEARHYAAEDGSQLAESEMMTEAVCWTFRDMHERLLCMIDRVPSIIASLPEDIGLASLRAVPDPAFRLGPFSDGMYRAMNALERVADTLNLPSATAYLAAMPLPERTEWLSFATALYAPHELSGNEEILRAADCARAPSGGVAPSWSKMCEGPGKCIPKCPRQGLFRARIKECDRCRENDPWHDGHLYCEYHLGLMVDGTYRNGDGESLTVCDYGAVGDGAPF